MRLTHMFGSKASTSTKLLVGLISFLVTIVALRFALVFLVDNLIH